MLSDDVVRVVVDGHPVAKGRPRFNRATGSAYTPAHTRKYETHVRMAAQMAMAERRPLDEAVWVCVTAYLPVPQSWSGKKTRAALAGALRPTARPDVDQYIKAALDGCNEIVWRDDSQVVELFAAKVFDVDPRLEIEVRPVVVLPLMTQPAERIAAPALVQGSLL